MSYKKTYIKAYGEIPQGYEVHHVDWDRANNDPSNLIALPKAIHKIIHHHIGYANRDECQLMVSDYEGISNPERFSLSAMANRMKKYVTHEKSVTSRSIKARYDQNKLTQIAVRQTYL